jgi:CarboxypepD_reg-like domain
MIVNGQLIGYDMEIIPNANVIVVGENRSTTTDAAGRFTIVANSPASTLRFSHAGYDFDEAPAGYFIDNSYYTLYNESLPDAVVDNNYKAPDNTIWWILGITTAIAVAIVATRKKIPTVNV